MFLSSPLKLASLNEQRQKLILNQTLATMTAARVKDLITCSIRTKDVTSLTVFVSYSQVVLASNPSQQQIGPPDIRSFDKPRKRKRKKKKEKKLQR